MLGPVAVGLGLGRVAGGVPSPADRVAAVVVGLLGGAVLAVATQAVGLWDALWIGGAAGVGVALADRPARPAGAAALSVVLFAGVADLAGRALLPRAPEPRDEAGLSLRFEGLERYGEHTCGLVDPRFDDGAAWAGVAGTDPVDEPVVLHLGDSMLVFTSPGPGGSVTHAPTRLPERLDAADASARHLNAGTPGSSYDAHLLVARRALATLPVRAVVLHALMSNDLTELGRVHPCCPGGGLVDEAAPGLPARCPTPIRPWSWAPRVGALVLRSRPPMWLRVATRHSPLVGHLRFRLAGWLGPASPVGMWVDSDDLAVDDEAPELTRAWDRARALLAALQEDTRRAGAELVVVAMPIGPSLGEDQAPRNLRARARVPRLAALCAELGVAFLDAAEAMPERPVDPRAFLPDGYHLSADGHARLAAWLLPRLPQNANGPDP